MLTALLSIAGGLTLLGFGGEYLVKGASRFALGLGVPALVVGLTIVAIGTSMPEMVTSLIAQAQGEVTIALANVIGSNIANIALVLGAGALMRPLPVDLGCLKRDLPFLGWATLGFVAVIVIGPNVSRFDGVLLLVGMAAFLVLQVFVARAAPVRLEAEVRQEMKRIERPVHQWTMFQSLLAMLGGIALLVAGGHLTVTGSVTLAQMMGISDRVIGLTIVAIGTSLPELVTTLAAIRHGEVDVAIGNVLGSNIANMLLIGGAVAVMSPAVVEPAMQRIDLPIMLLVTGLLAFLLFQWRTLARWMGALFCLLYVTYLILLLALPGG